MISVIDMPPPDESIWWRGKRGFEVGFFPCEYVEVIGDKVPQGLNLPMGANHRLNRKDSVSSEDEGQGSPTSEPTKPVLRKHGKLISFFRSFILSRPARGKLKKSGILKERVFGCDLSEHLLSTGQDVPKVLTHCAEFIEAKGIIDGIYRLSGIASNIQKLRYVRKLKDHFSIEFRLTEKKAKNLGMCIYCEAQRPSEAAQCGNYRIFLSLRFYVKSNLANQESQNLPF